MDGGGVSVGREGEELVFPQLFEAGHFAALCIGIIFFALSAQRVNEDEAKMVRARSQQRPIFYANSADAIVDAGSSLPPPPPTHVEVQRLELRTALRGADENLKKAKSSFADKIEKLKKRWAAAGR